jgi:hypothetical protein
VITFAWIVCGLIVASSLFALLVPSGPEATLSDVARQMETMRRSQAKTSSDIEGSAER